MIGWGYSWACMLVANAGDRQMPIIRVLHFNLLDLCCDSGKWLLKIMPAWNYNIHLFWLTFIFETCMGVLNEHKIVYSAM